MHLVGNTCPQPMDVAFFAGVEVSQMLEDEACQFDAMTAMNVFTVFFMIIVGISSYKINVEKSKSPTYSKQNKNARHPKTGLPAINMVPVTITFRQIIVTVISILVFVGLPKSAIEQGLLKPELLLESPWMSYVCSFVILFSFQSIVLILAPLIVLCSSKKLRKFAQKVFF